MAALLALAPIIVLLACMSVLGWSAARAGLLGAATALGLAIFAFDYGTDPVSLAGPLLEALFTAATILLIVFPALTLHELQTRSGAAARMGAWLGTITDNRNLLALILAWFFALLLEGVAGFGTPVALVAPMLVALGYPAQRALVMALAGHALGVTFGGVGIPMVPLLEMSDLEASDLALTTLMLHGALGWIITLAIFRLAGRPRSPADWLAPFLAAALFLIPAAALGHATGTELPTIGGALIGGGLFILAVRWGWPVARAQGAKASAAHAGAIWQAALPYLMVVLAILATRLIAPLGALLEAFVVQWQWGSSAPGEGFGGEVRPLFHPGFLMLLALGATVLARTGDRPLIAAALRSAIGHMPPVAGALVSVLFLAGLMVHSGMVDTLAKSAAALFGPAWPIMVPMTGTLGAFITGSATASNILFGSFHLATAEATLLSPLLALSGQSLGAAIGNMIAPHNIVAGAATVGLIGREGAILRSALPLCLAYAGLGGLLLWLLASI